MAVLNRPAGDGVGIEEMDSLQMEMESLLVHAMQRTRLLKLETMILDNGSTDKAATAELMRVSHTQLTYCRNIAFATVSRTVFDRINARTRTVT